MPSVETYLANYEDPVHAKAVVDLLDGYARDPYGNSGPLPDDVYVSLCPTLAKTPGAFSVVATVDGVAAGLINCFQGFSTFKCKPLINVHDVFVHPEHRRAGLVQAMMALLIGRHEDSRLPVLDAPIVAAPPAGRRVPTRRVRPHVISPRL